MVKHPRHAYNFPKPPFLYIVLKVKQLLQYESVYDDCNTQILIFCLVCFPLVVGVLCLSLFCYALIFSFAIILKRKKELIALLLLSYRCLVTVNILSLFLMVPWVGMRCVIVIFPDHTHLDSLCPNVQTCQNY